MDLIWAAADRVVLFRVQTKMAGCVELAKSLHENTLAVHEAITELRNKKYKRVLESCVEINSFENEADGIFKRAICRMFEEEKDPIVIIKWKEILEHMEHATDKCEDVANAL